jgi:hypothetical protein
LLELREDAVVEMSPHIGTGDGVCFAGIDLKVIRDASLDELLNELDGVLNVNVVVAGSMGQEQAAL